MRVAFHCLTLIISNNSNADTNNSNDNVIVILIIVIIIIVIVVIVVIVVILVIVVITAVGSAGGPSRRAPFWLRRNGVNTNGAAAKVIYVDRLGNRVRPGTFGNIKVG